MPNKKAEKGFRVIAARRYF